MFNVYVRQQKCYLYFQQIDILVISYDADPYPHHWFLMTFSLP